MQFVSPTDEAKGWTQESLAERAGIHWTTVGKVERGQLVPSVALLVLLVRALEVPVAEALAKVLAEPGMAAEEDATVRYVRGLPRRERARLLPVLRTMMEWKGVKSSEP